VRSKNPPSDPNKFSVELTPTTAAWVREKAQEYGLSMRSVLIGCVLAAMAREEQERAVQAQEEEEGG
jgi:hypothetical protein